MENKKDISFIIPVFNTKQDQIIRCLDSVIKIKSSIETEIIVVDDGSLPENSKIYKKLVNKYNGIYLYEENSGVSSARNKGLSYAKGEYVFFLDADDEVDGKKFDRSQLSKKADIIIFDLLLKNESNNTNSIYGLNKKNREIFNSSNFWSYLLKDGLGNWAAGKLFKRIFLIDNGILFNTKLIEGEDIDFVYRSLSCNPVIEYIKEEIYVYHLSPDTGESRKKLDPLKYLKGIIRVYEIRSIVIQKVNMKNKQQIFKEICKVTTNRIFLTYAYLIWNKKNISNKEYDFFDHCVRKIKCKRKLDNRSKFQIFLIEHHYKGVPVVYYYLRLMIHFMKNRL